MKNKAFGLFIGLVLFLNGQSQVSELPLLYSLKTEYFHQAAQNKDTTQLIYAPLYSDDISKTDGIPFVHIDSSKTGSWVGRKLFRENFLILHKKDIYLTVDPIFNFTVGVDQANPSNKTLYQNTRGVKIEGILGKRIVFSTSFLENQARFPDYMNSFIESTGVVPGMGRVKSFKDGEYDYSMATASISYKINKHIRVKLGNDKDFLGFGYRSILLSDNAFNYPHLKIDFTFAHGKIRYTLNYALLQNLNRLPNGETPESLFERKMGAFHYLSFKVSNKATFGLYSGTVFQELPNSTEAFFNAFNPIITINQFSNIPNYSRTGLLFSLQFSEKVLFYSEFSFFIDVINGRPKLDDYAFLAGFLLTDIAKGLDLTFEFSIWETMKYFDPFKKYSHYNQSLAHPLGSGFSEIYFRAHYSINHFHINYSINFARQNYNDVSSWTYIFQEKSDPSPIYLKRSILNIELFYMVNPKTNMNIALGYQYRIANDKTNYLYLTFRTTLFNEYRDF
jgi:hypothetical protein